MQAKKVQFLRGLTACLHFTPTSTAVALQPSVPTAPISIWSASTFQCPLPMKRRSLSPRLAAIRRGAGCLKQAKSTTSAKSLVRKESQP